MRVRTILLASLVGFGVACGGSTKPVAPPPKPDPIAKTTGPSCAVVSEHLATLVERDATQTAKADTALRARCQTDAWSDDARNCFATAQADAEVDGCKGMLTPGQREAFGAAKDAWSVPASDAKP